MASQLQILSINKLNILPTIKQTASLIPIKRPCQMKQIKTNTNTMMQYPVRGHFSHYTEEIQPITHNNCLKEAALSNVLKL